MPLGESSGSQVFLRVLQEKEQAEEEGIRCQSVEKLWRGGGGSCKTRRNEDKDVGCGGAVFCSPLFSSLLPRRPASCQLLLASARLIWQTTTAANGSAVSFKPGATAKETRGLVVESANKK